MTTDPKDDDLLEAYKRVAANDPREDLIWLDNALLELYTKVKNQMGARKLVGRPVEGLEFALDQIQHIRMDLEDFKPENPREE